MSARHEHDCRHGERFIETATSNQTLGVLQSFQPTVQPTVINILYIVLGIFGSLGNAVSFGVLVCYKPLRKRLHNLFLINLCLVDLVVSILLIPNKIIDFHTTNEALCYLWQAPTIRAGLYVSSVYSIAALAVERYLEVVHPLAHRVYATRRCIILVLTGIWLFGPLFKMAVMLPGTKVVQGRCAIMERFVNMQAQRAAGMINVSIEYFAPLLIILFCYIAIRYSLRHKVKPSKPTGTFIAPKSVMMSRVRRQITITLIVVVACYVICTTFRQVILVLNHTGIRPLTGSDVVFDVSELMANASSCVYPYICFSKHNEFKRGARELFCSWPMPDVGESHATPVADLLRRASAAGSAAKTTGGKVSEGVPSGANEKGKISTIA